MEASKDSKYLPSGGPEGGGNRDFVLCIHSQRPQTRRLRSPTVNSGVATQLWELWSFLSQRGRQLQGRKFWPSAADAAVIHRIKALGVSVTCVGIVSGSCRDCVGIMALLFQEAVTSSTADLLSSCGPCIRDFMYNKLSHTQTDTSKQKEGLASITQSGGGQLAV